MARTGHYRWWPRAGAVLTPALAGLLVTVGLGTPALSVGRFALVLGTGVAKSTQLWLLAAQNAAPARHGGTATSTVLAVPLPRATWSASPSSGASSTPDNPASVTRMPVTFADTLPGVFLAVVPVALVAVVVSLRLQDRPLRTEVALDPPPPTHPPWPPTRLTLLHLTRRSPPRAPDAGPGPWPCRRAPRRGRQ